MAEISELEPRIAELNQKLGASQDRLKLLVADIDRFAEDKNASELAGDRRENAQEAKFIRSVARTINDVRESFRKASRAKLETLINERSRTLCTSMIWLLESNWTISIPCTSSMLTASDWDGEPIERPQAIAATALLWAMKDAAVDIAMPVIIDTPLGRIDRQNQERLLLHYYTQISEQVIILPTNSEIDRSSVPYSRATSRPNMLSATSAAIAHPSKQARRWRWPDGGSRYVSLRRIGRWSKPFYGRNRRQVSISGPWVASPWRDPCRSLSDPDLTTICPRRSSVRRGVARQSADRRRQGRRSRRWGSLQGSALRLRRAQSVVGEAEFHEALQRHIRRGLDLIRSEWSEGVPLSRYLLDQLLFDPDHHSSSGAESAETGDRIDRISANWVSGPKSSKPLRDLASLATPSNSSRSMT